MIVPLVAILAGAPLKIVLPVAILVVVVYTTLAGLVFLGFKKLFINPLRNLAELISSIFNRLFTDSGAEIYEKAKEKRTQEAANQGSEEDTSDNTNGVEAHIEKPIGVQRDFTVQTAANRVHPDAPRALEIIYWNGRGQKVITQIDWNIFIGTAQQINPNIFNGVAAEKAMCIQHDSIVQEAAKQGSPDAKSYLVESTHPFSITKGKKVDSQKSTIIDQNRLFTWMAQGGIPIQLGSTTREAENQADSDAPRALEIIYWNGRGQKVITQIDWNIFIGTAQQINPNIFNGVAAEKAMCIQHDSIVQEAAKQGSPDAKSYLVESTHPFSITKGKKVDSQKSTIIDQNRLFTWMAQGGIPIQLGSTTREAENQADSDAPRTLEIIYWNGRGQKSTIKIDQNRFAGMAQKAVALNLFSSKTKGAPNQEDSVESALHSSSINGKVDIKVIRPALSRQTAQHNTHHNSTPPPETNQGDLNTLHNLVGRIDARKFARGLRFFLSVIR